MGDLLFRISGFFFLFYSVFKLKIYVIQFISNKYSITFFLQLKPHTNPPQITYHTTYIGVTGKMSTQGKDEDDNFGTEASQKAILRALGQERFNKVFSGLYVCRHDSSPTVRQAALHVWKMLVTHTPRTLRDIMATLFSLLLLHLSSPSYDKRHVGEFDEEDDENEDVECLGD